MKHILFVILLITCSYRVFTQDTVSVQQNELVELQSAIIRHSHKDTIRVHVLTDYANLCFYNLDFLNGFKALSEARIISKQLKFTRGEGLYLKSISIFRRRINAGNAFIKTQDINKVNEVAESINNLDIYYEVEGNRVLKQYTDFEIFGIIDMPLGIRDSEIETIISKLEEALSYYSEKENVEITAYLHDALSFIYFNSDKEKSKKHKKVAQGLYQELKWSYHQLLILARDIDDLLELGMEAEAKPLEIEAINIYTNEADKYVKAHCAYLLSRAYGIHNRVNLQLEYLFQAEELLTEIEEKDLLKPVYISVAIVYEWLMTNSEKALEYEYKELNLRKEINYYERVAYTYLLISESLLGLKRIQDFPPEYKDYLKVGGVKGSLFFDAEFLWVKARMLQAQGKNEEAQPVFQESISAYQKANDPIGGIWPSMNLAESFRGDGEFKNAIKHALIAYEWASKDKLGFLQFRAADLLSQLYEQSGDKSKAFDYLKKYRAIKDETEKLYSAARISELEVQSILNKRQREIELLESESQLKEQKNKTQRIWLFSIAGALASLVFLSFILVRNNRQKQKANQVLNSKNRELEIEAALERVRSASMAMHKSEELVDVATVLYKELRNLDVREFSDASIAIFDESKNQQILYGGARTDADYLEMAVFPLLGDEILQKLYDLWSRKETFFTVKVEGSALKKHCEFVFPIASRTELEAKVIEGMPDPTFFHCAYFSMGYLELVSDKELGEGSSIILTRFAKVFDQSYTRFLDLQKAEAQAREAQIEAALERIRARSMAMFKSEELANVVSLMYAQIQNLGFTDWGCAIVLCDEEAQIMRYWYAELNMSHSPEFFTVPLTNKTIRKVWKLWKQGIPQFTIELLNKEKDEFTEYMLTETDHKNLPDEVKDGWRSVENVFFCYNNIKYGFLEFVEIVPFAEENLLVYQRFAKVFEQTYTRFLDLQKAEVQAREAQIEAGLERVRSRSMAMHKSEELSELVTLFYDEIKPFGFATAGVELILMDEKNELQQYWLSTAPETKIIECFNIPTSIHPHFQKQWKAWKDQIPRLSLTLEGQEKKAFDQLIFTQTDFKNLPDDVKEFIQNHGNVDVFSHVIMKYGLLQAVDKSPLSEEKFVILERFAKVFQQTYTRFLDLQKSEAQAREAKIEASLERVRTQAMSMHKSDDLLNISKVLYEELKMLGIDEIRNAMVLIHDEKNNFFLDYDYSSIGGKITRIPTNGISLVEKYVKELQENEKSKVSFLELIVSGEELESWKKARKATGQLDDPRLDSMEALYYYHYSIGKGNISISTFSTLSNKKLQVLERFRNVFQLPYQRYHDIEIAVAQTEQARLNLIQIQTEKKRAEDALTILKATQTQLIQSEKLASLGELTAGIAHEIQNPLNFVNNFSEVSNELIDEMKTEFKKGDTEEGFFIADDIKQNLEKILHHGKRADAIVKGMLQHSRTSSGQKELTDINALCDEYLRLAYHGLRAKDKAFNAKFETAFDPKIEAINVIPQEIGRVILNLINNAFYAVTERQKHGTAGYEPAVTISTKNSGTSISISVKDNGSGIPQKVQDKIFQPFFTTKPTGQGTGLGLSLSYDIVKAHGGELKVETTEGKGSEFVIKLPTQS